MNPLRIPALVVVGVIRFLNGVMDDSYRIWRISRDLHRDHRAVVRCPGCTMPVEECLCP